MHQSPEELHGVLSRVFLIWINRVLLRGYKNILVNQDAPPLSPDTKPEVTRRRMLSAWSQRAKPETKKSLPLALLRCLKKPFFAAILPRLFLIIFRYSQPALISESIRYVMTHPSDAGSSRGFWIVLSAAAVYVGLAVSTAVYQHRLNRLKLMIRSSLVGLIHEKAMKSPSVAYDDGEATTLMSTDAEGLEGIGEMVHETWAQVIEVLIGMAFLATKVGWIWPLPLVLIYLCSHVSRFVAKHLHVRQRAWNAATQNRLAATTAMLGAMKTAKMLGFQDSLMFRIQELRQLELFAASKLRWVMVYYNASANALGIFSPALTLITFTGIAVARGGKLATETAFTTMAILSMVTHPANMIMTIVPRAVAAFTGFERIQSFLLRQPIQANRGKVSESAEKKLSPHAPAIQIRDLRIGHENLVLNNVNIELPTGSFYIISGPTGSGKSTLLRAILGEVTSTHGSINLSTKKIAYCSQRPWLPSGTIKEVIYGLSDTNDVNGQRNETWYLEVTNICCLDHDFDSLPDGDQTQIGSRGLNLSGGQKQRVTLARALFAKCDILLLDDTFSGLDGETEKSVFNSLFGPKGLIRRLKTTVILASNSSQYFQAADQIVILGSNTIIDQGHWKNIMHKAASLAKYSSSRHVADNRSSSASFHKLSGQLQAKNEAEIDLARRSGDPTLYGYYFGFIGFRNLFLLVSITATYAFFIIIPQYWLQLWTEADRDNTAFFVGGFLFLSTMAWMFTSAQMWSVLIQIAPQSGSQLHQRLLAIVTSAPLSFFSRTDSGSILNRFSQDIQLIDKQLPSALQTIVTQICKLLMQIVLLFMAEKWLSLSLPVCLVVLYVVQKVYLRTSRQLRFLELEGRAEVFSNFLESLEGLETIRSFGWSKVAIENNIRIVDNSQRPEFLHMCLQRWLNVVLDILAAAIATGTVALAVAFRGHVRGAQVGIALNVMLVANTTLLKLVESWISLETSLGAIARLKTLEEMTLSEGIKNESLEPPNWPSRGEIQLKDVTASYQSVPESVAIRNLSLNISAGQKLIVCGRTGSGKSTLLLTLLRLLKLQSGKIELDGIDIKDVRLDILRQRCFIVVSQDPLILPMETLRFNLNPEASVSDEILVDALTKMDLWLHFTESGGERDTAVAIPGIGRHPILDQKVSQLQELSVGQRQLFALCRALVKVGMLRRSGFKPVIMLDEVTSSLDTVTESTIYRIINDEFTEKGHTTIIVAHRLGGLGEYIESGRDFMAFMADGRLQAVSENLDWVTFRRFSEID
ncbi:putative ABC transporter [Talaromyces proteolyticus]|uniref:ABC transporter n=1 Tax=Talaromyces proteolyticus TaxID=1131652 RepID=A0AAD4KGK6_9EURO|nr:putative ABC transporter [Talaromyces proteolyticus]KAH8689022.1 putative ABC transporter [Talaromyces proteolyticus]